MKRIIYLLIGAVLVLSLAGCGENNLSLTENLAPAFQPESAQESASESVLESTPSVPAGEAENVPSQAESWPEDEPVPLPPMVRIRWQQGEFPAMIQLPLNGLDSFWEHADHLLTEVEAPAEPDPEDGGFDYLVSSPYYSGQEALLEDLFRFSDELPQRFYWIDEDAVRAAWEIGTYLSVTCQDRVVHFDWNGHSDEDLEFFDLFLAMSPEAKLPDLEGGVRLRYTLLGEWEEVPGHPGFEMVQVAGELLPPDKTLLEQLLLS